MGAFVSVCSSRIAAAGCEVAVGQRVTLSHQKVALFTWAGATVELEGSPDIACVAASGFAGASSDAAAAMLRVTRRWCPT
jgi:hypothetical protein